MTNWVSIFAWCPWIERPENPGTLTWEYSCSKIGKTICWLGFLRIPKWVKWHPLAARFLGRKAKITKATKNTTSRPFGAVWDFRKFPFSPPVWRAKSLGRAAMSWVVKRLGLKNSVVFFRKMEAMQRFVFQKNLQAKPLNWGARQQGGVKTLGMSTPQPAVKSYWIRSDLGED